jgi:signal transduction histidine kinase
MLVPLQSRGEVIGLLRVRAAAQGQSFSNENAVLAQTVAGTLANALENARLVAAERAMVAEEERANIARELHDSVTQALYAANLTAGVLPSIWEANPEKGREAVQVVQLFTQTAMAEMRTLLVELRPAAIINTPLRELLETLRIAVAKGPDLEIEAVLAATPLLPPEAQVAMYRIAQEALNNIVKHSHCHHARIALNLMPPFAEQADSGQWSGTLVMRIADDGRGFDPAQAAPGRLGLASMRERAAEIGATLEVTSHPGDGTEIEVRWTGSARVPDEVS